MLTYLIAAGAFFLGFLVCSLLVMAGRDSRRDDEFNRTYSKAERAYLQGVEHGSARLRSNVAKYDKGEGED
jgi:hypothetical protein